jgi:hypothetical protein
MRKLVFLLALVVVTCSPVLAQSAGPISPGPSPSKLTEAEIVSILGSDLLYKGSDIAQWLATDLLPEVREEIRTTSEAAAAEAVKPVLVALAGARAEVAVWRRRAVWIGVAGGILAAVLAGIAAVR